MTAAKVPPKTIIIGGSKKSALTVPPSIKKAPKIENTPKTKPLKALYFLIIGNQVKFVVIVLPLIFAKPEVNNPGFVNQQQPLQYQLHFHPVQLFAN